MVSANERETLVEASSSVLGYSWLSESWGRELAMRPPEEFELFGATPLDWENWYKTESSRLERYLYLAKQSLGDRQQGIIQPIIVCVVNGEGFVGDGYHRLAVAVILAAQEEGLLADPLPESFSFERERKQLIADLKAKRPNLTIPAIVDLDSSWQRLWRIRASSLIGPDKERVRYARMIQMAEDTWPKSKWGEAGVSFMQALLLAESGRQIKSLGAVGSRELEDHMRGLAEAWGLSPRRMLDYFRLQARLHPSVSDQVTVGYGSGGLNISHAEIIAQNLASPRLLDIQLYVVDLLTSERLVPAWLEEFCEILAKFSKIMPVTVTDQEVIKLVERWETIRFMSISRIVFRYFDPLLDSRELSFYRARLHELIRLTYSQVEAEKLKNESVLRLADTATSCFFEQGTIINSQTKIDQAFGEAEHIIRSFSGAIPSQASAKSQRTFQREAERKHKFLDLSLDDLQHLVETGWSGKEGIVTQRWVIIALALVAFDLLDLLEEGEVREEVRDSLSLFVSLILEGIMPDFLDDKISRLLSSVRELTRSRYGVPRGPEEKWKRKILIQLEKEVPDE